MCALSEEELASDVFMPRSIHDVHVSALASSHMQQQELLFFIFSPNQFRHWWQPWGNFNDSQTRKHLCCPIVMYVCVCIWPVLAP